MSKLSQFFKQWYMRFFRWILVPEHTSHPVMEFKVHMLLTVVFVTGILMWAYAFLSFEYVNHPSIKYTGIIYALLHMLSPLVYRMTKSITAATYMMLVPGGIFQTHFSLLTGGFFTTTIVWVGILPLIAGILTDRFHTIVWGIFATIAIILTFTLSLCGLTGDYFIDSGRTVAQFQVTFGMILLNSAFTIFLLILSDKYEGMQARRKIAFQNLLRIMVHDIANPLTVITSMAKSLPLVKEDPVQEEFFQKQIVYQATKMGSIIESVRWMEGLESGKRTPKTQVVDLNKIVHEAVENISEMAKLKNITLEINLPENLQGLGHPTVIENQVLTNILTNCIKFSEENTKIKITGNTQSIHTTLITISDQGIGIPTNILDHLFDPFYPTTRKGTSGEEGTGFGMPIAQKSMEFFKGHISVTSTEKHLDKNNHGTTFKLYFRGEDNQ